MAKKAAKFNSDERTMIARAAQQVWDEIGYDCLNALADERAGYALDDDRAGRRAREGVTMSRRDVIEVVLDASRFEDALARVLRVERLRREPRPLDPQLHARAVDDIYGKRSEIEAFLKSDVFKHARYGF